MTTNVTATAAPAAIPTFIGAFTSFQNDRYFFDESEISEFDNWPEGLKQ